MCWGIETGDGWYDILDHLCRKLTVIQQELGVVIRADQVKEKFGTLRFYFTAETSHELWTDIIEDVVDKAEAQSATICEECGSWGRLGHKDRIWLGTRCDKCAEKEGYTPIRE